ncbi:MAG: alanine racemase, partial [Gammaproteobacteria bacterium]|nr:alanine racemase [Gammaproteobacteria bacterium]
MHTRIAKISIDAEALQHNLLRVKTFAPNSKVIAVIKANAYGHDVQTVANALAEADAFALATPNEAICLRQSGVTKPLMVLQGFSSIEELKALADLDIQVVVHQQSQIDLLEQCPDVKLDLWLKIDTGMHRLGMSVEMAESAHQRLQACESVNYIRLMSHFANADDPAHPMNQAQLSAFSQMCDRFGQGDASMANSAALVAMPESHMQWV